MNFDTIKTGSFGVGGGVFEPRHDPGQFLVAQLARQGVGLFSFRRVHLVAGDRDGAGCDRLRAVVEEGVASTATVPDLQKNPAALGMNGLGDAAPTIDLGVIVNSRLGVKSRVALHRHRGLCDDQACRGALGVVFRHQRAGHMASFGATAGEGGHEDAVGQFQRAEVEFFEKRSGMMHGD